MLNKNPNEKEVSEIKEAILEGVIPNEYEASYQFMLIKGLALGFKKV